MEQEDGLQETADRVARAKFSLRRPEYFCSYVSNGRPLVWWYGGVKVALRIDSRDGLDFAKKFDLNL